MNISLLRLIFLLGCYVQYNSAFFWKVRLIYSTLDPEPSWPPEILAEAAAERKRVEDAWATSTISPEDKAKLKEILDRFVANVKTKEEWKYEMGEYFNVFFLTIKNILGHRIENWKLKFRYWQDLLRAKFFLDGKPKKYMLNNCERIKFHAGENDKYIRSRWKKFGKDIWMWKTMMYRITRNFLDHNYPDGFIRTMINDFMGYESPKRAEMIRNRPTTKKPTTVIRNEEYFATWTPPNFADKKKK